MTFLVERLADLRRYLDHLRALRSRVSSRAVLERDLSLHNDVLFSLLMVSQLVIDVAGELSARRGDRFEDYTEAIRNLARDARFPVTLVAELEGFGGYSPRSTWIGSVRAARRAGGTAARMAMPVRSDATTIALTDNDDHRTTPRSDRSGV